jgi:hypothetical protein
MLCCANFYDRLARVFLWEPSDPLEGSLASGVVEAICILVVLLNVELIVAPADLCRGR